MKYGFGAHVEGKSDLVGAPRLAHDLIVWPCQLIDKRQVVRRAPGSSALIIRSANLLHSFPSSSSIFSEDGSATVTVCTVPPPSIPTIVILAWSPPSWITTLRRLVVALEKSVSTRRVS